MRQTLEQQERMLKPFMKNRWLYTGVLLFIIGTSIQRIFEKRSEWPFIIKFSLPPGVSVWSSVWENIFTAAMCSFVLILWWVRIHNYRRELLLADQLASQKAARPPEGVWPPPPVS